MDAVGKYYKQLDTVEIASNSIRSPYVRTAAIWALFLASAAFFVAAAVALFESLHRGRQPRMAIKLYLVILITMVAVDVLAVLYEGKSIFQQLREHHKPILSEWISILVSIVVGGITYYLFTQHLARYRAGCTHARLDVLVITLMKMAVALVVAYRAYEKLRAPTLAEQNL